MGPLRRKLRLATQAEHRSLEACLDLMRSDLTRAAYVRYVERSFHYYAAVEPLLYDRADLQALGIDGNTRAKLQWLEQDLRYFEILPSAGAGPATPIERSSSLAEALGCSYVLEGATLGGAYLHTQLRVRWGIEQGRGGSFLYGYGSETPRMWKAFTTVLEAAPLSGAEEVTCIAAARLTFSTIREWHARAG